eukprot:3606010-Prymnesium_polylepis.1
MRRWARAARLTTNTTLGSRKTPPALKLVFTVTGCQPGGRRSGRCTSIVGRRKCRQDRRDTRRAGQGRSARKHVRCRRWHVQAGRHGEESAQ